MVLAADHGCIEKKSLVHDLVGADVLLPTTKAQTVIADKAYGAQESRLSLHLVDLMTHPSIFFGRFLSSKRPSPHHIGLALNGELAHQGGGGAAVGAPAGFYFQAVALPCQAGGEDAASVCGVVEHV